MLQEIQRDETLRAIPVVVCSASPRREDRERALSGGARRYVVKPAKFNLWLDEIRSAAREFPAGLARSSVHQPLKSSRSASRLYHVLQALQIPWLFDIFLCAVLETKNSIRFARLPGKHHDRNLPE